MFPEPAADVFAPFIVGGGLIFARVASALLVVPGFAQGTLPTRVRVLIALLMTGMIDMGLGFAHVPLPNTAVVLGSMITREILFGVGMGLAVRMMLAAVEAAGAIAGINMGLSLNVFVDPTSGEETMTLGSMMSVCAALMFIAMDGHHVVITGLFQHLQEFPVGHTLWFGPSLETLMEISGRICVTAVILASPVIVVTLLLNVALALVSRVVPSVNLFGIGLGLLTFTGMLSLAFEGEAILVFVERSIQTLPIDMWDMSGMEPPEA